MDEVAASFGYTAPGWYRELKACHAAHAGDPDTLAAAGRAAGLDDVQVRARTVDAGPVGARDLVRWRLGLSSADRERLTALAVARVGSDTGRLQPTVLLLTAAV